MKISDAIKELEKIKEENGDLEMCIYANSGIDTEVPYVTVDYFTLSNTDFYDYNKRKIVRDSSIVILE